MDNCNIKKNKWVNCFNLVLIFFYFITLSISIINIGYASDELKKVVPKDTKAEEIKAEKAKTATKAPWAMTRKEWDDAKQPDLNIDWSDNHPRTQPASINSDYNEEVRAINTFIKLFKSPLVEYNRGCIGPVTAANGEVRGTESVEKDRQEKFAKSTIKVQSYSMLRPGPYNCPLKVREKLRLTNPNLFRESSIEDAREAIILGRKLGYHEYDILRYVIDNYNPASAKTCDQDLFIPEDV
ncbi:MAG: hypothetical protein HQK51_03345 [Oligoflexia bacterium]|nr:hypothetical protein [Oligoflexia bacterium]